MREEVILILDEVSRNKLKVDVSELIINNINIIPSLEEITSSDSKKTVIILEGFLSSNHYYSDLEMYKEILDLNYVFIGTDKNLLNIMKGLASCYYGDFTLIDSEMIDRAIYNVEGSEDEQVNSLESDVLRMLEENHPDNVKNVLRSYLSILEVLDSKIRMEKEKNEEISNLKINLFREMDEKKKYKEMCFDFIDKSKDLNRTLKQYETILSRDVYDKISLNKYSERPKIIYLKEYEPLLNFETFIETLYSLFSWQIKKSVKVLRLYDSSSSKRVVTLPDYYEIVGNKFIRSDIISNDFVCKVGGYREVLDIILTNQSRLDVLLIVDCKDHSDTVVSGKVLELSLCSNYENIEKYGLSEKNTVTNSKDDEGMSWNPRDTSGMSDEEKLLYLTTIPVIRKIYEMYQIILEEGV